LLQFVLFLTLILILIFIQSLACKNQVEIMHFASIKHEHVCTYQISILSNY